MCAKFMLLCLCKITDIWTQKLLNKLLKQIAPSSDYFVTHRRWAGTTDWRNVCFVSFIDVEKRGVQFHSYSQPASNAMFITKVFTVLF